MYSSIHVRPRRSVRQHAARVDAACESLEREVRRFRIPPLPGGIRGPDEQRHAAALRQSRIPRRAQHLPVRPVEVVHPHVHAVAVGHQLPFEPVGRRQPRLLVVGCARLAPAVEAGEAVLRDGDGVVLTSDVALVVEQRHAVGVERPAIGRLALKAHEVLPAVFERPFVHERRLVPERERTGRAVRVHARDAGEVRDPARSCRRPRRSL